jgi:hypothetical protein
MSETRGRRGGIGGVPVGFAAPVLLLMTCLSLGAGQIEKDTKLAATIEGRKKILVRTPESEEREIHRPRILADGLEGWDPSSGQSVRFSWAEIRAIQVRKRGARTGGWIGSALGFAGGIGAGAILVSLAEGDLTNATILIGGVGGMAAGALTGSLIGSLFNGWRTVYGAETGSCPVPMISLAPSRGGGMALTLAVGF